jgi:hypothetical protein
MLPLVRTTACVSIGELQRSRFIELARLQHGRRGILMSFFSLV